MWTKKQSDTGRSTYMPFLRGTANSGAGRIFIVLGVAALSALLLGGCKSEQQRRDELSAQFNLEQRRQAHALQVLREQQDHQTHLTVLQNQHELDQQKIEEEASTKRTKKILSVTAVILVVGIVAGTICWLAFVLYRLANVRVQEREKTNRAHDAVALIADAGNGLSNEQRERLLGQVLGGTGYPQLPPPGPDLPDEPPA